MPQRRLRLVIASAAVLALVVIALIVERRFAHDIDAARANAALGSVLLPTRCGPIEVQQRGQGVPLLMIHGSGGGHDQGMAFAAALAQQGVHVIAVSRFGYLRTPLPADATPAAQADAHVCVLDALGIPRAAVLGASAGAPSATQLAIRHPDRVSALILVVPMIYKPAAVADSVPPPSPWAEKLLLRLIGSDFVYWSALRLARDQLIRRVLATPPDLVAAASPAEQARVQAMLDGILPLSARAEGLRNETAIAKSLAPYALQTIRAPTLVISLRDDGYGTYASAEYTASRIAGAKFIGFDQGGHLGVGHDDEIRRAIAAHLKAYAAR